MDKYKETFETWNKIAALYQDKFMNLNLYNETYDYICNSIHEKAKSLEIGCGPGIIIKYLLAKRPDLDIFGIDIAPNMIELAKKNNPSSKFEVMDCRQISNIKTKFDVILCGFCLPYLTQADSRKLIADCYNLLNDEGLIYLSFVEGDPGKSDYQVSSSGDRVFFHFYNSDELKSILIEENFIVSKEFKVEYTKTNAEMDIHTIFISRKKKYE